MAGKESERTYTYGGGGADAGWWLPVSRARDVRGARRDRGFTGGTLVRGVAIAVDGCISRLGARFPIRRRGGRGRRVDLGFVFGAFGRGWIGLRAFGRWQVGLGFVFRVFDRGWIWLGRVFNRLRVWLRFVFFVFFGWEPAAKLEQAVEIFAAGSHPKNTKKTNLSQ